jgi:outer membrane protein OmpA-like peptidoglycan-associated protein
MRLKLFFTTYLFYALGIAQPSNIPFTEDHFKGRESELRQAVKEIKKGDKEFKKGKAGYINAIEPYMKAYFLNQDNASLNFKIGVCFLKGKIDPKALEYFKHAARIDLWVSDSREIRKLMFDHYFHHIYYMLAQSYHLNLEWDKAIDNYLNFKSVLHPDDLEVIEKLIEKKVEECVDGRMILQEPINARIDNLGSKINSPYSDYGAFFTTDESHLFFTSRRKRTEKDKISRYDNQYYEDIYISEKNNEFWSNAINIGKPINTDNHDATAGLSNDGQKLFVFRNKKGKGGGDIYVSNLKGAKWKRAKKLPKPINSKYHETTASLSFDSRVLYFISERPGGYGGRDIYRAFKNADQKWDRVENLGSMVNSEFDEDFIFVHPDGKTLYFSSKGHNSMGGYDIFVTEMLNNGSFSKPKNVGYPVNSPGDDVEFRLSARGNKALYTSVRPGGIGEKDIYQIHFLNGGKSLVTTTEDKLISDAEELIVEEEIELEVSLPEKKVTILKGAIKDELTSEPIEASIELIDNEKKEVIATFSSNSNSGTYLVCLPSGKNYGISINSPGYLFHSENLDIPESIGYQEILKNINLKRLEAGSKIVLKNIFFDYDKSTIKSESFAELERLVELMIVESQMRVEISGHTDNKGSDTYNKTLSENRAKAVVELMIELGISPGRFEYKGYGFDRPIADNETENGRKENRRTEFKIISK